jgi:hypothetical protein
MSKYRRILLAITKGGISQSEIAASLHVSKRDVSAAAKVARERGLTFEQVGSMDEGAVTDTFFPREGRDPNPSYLRPDMAALVERKKRNRKLPVKLLWPSTATRSPRGGSSPTPTRRSARC